MIDRILIEMILDQKQHIYALTMHIFIDPSKFEKRLETKELTTFEMIRVHEKLLKLKNSS